MNRIQRSRRFLLNVISEPKEERDQSEEKLDCSDKSLPRLLKYCKNKSGSKSFEASGSSSSSFGKEIKNATSEVDSDHEYFSCENTGASSPSLQKRDLFSPKNLILGRSWSFQNIKECTSSALKKKSSLRNCNSCERVVSQEYQLALSRTVVRCQWDDIEGPRRDKSPELTREMEEAVNLLHKTAAKVRQRLQERLTCKHVECKSENDDFRIKFRGFHKINITQKLDPGFKEMTKMLVDLADHVDEKLQRKPIRRKSSLKKKKLKQKAPKDGRVTWDESHRNELLDLVDSKNPETKSWNKPRKTSACGMKLSLENSRNPLCSFTETTDEIKEEEFEFDGENDILNLNLCESDQLEVEERKISKLSSYKDSGNFDTLADQSVVMKPKTSEGSKRKRRRRLRKNTFKPKNPGYFEGIAKEIEEAKTISPMGKLEKAKLDGNLARTEESEGFSDFSNVSPAGKYSLKSGDLRNNVSKSPRRQTMGEALPKAHVLKLIESLSQIEKDL